MEVTNYFRSVRGHPQHVSVGCILVNNRNDICCHHFTPELLGLLSKSGQQLGTSHVYLLMRETIHPHETLEGALHRGLMEEFGATARLVDYVGSIVSHFNIHGEERQKTTLYFVAELLTQDSSKRNTSDIEGLTQIEWHTADFLIPLMKKQTAEHGRTDIDESSILERMKKQGIL